MLCLLSNLGLFRIILDFDPFHMVERRGFAMDMRLNMPQYKIRTHHFYAGLVDKVGIRCPPKPFYNFLQSLSLP
jgi:hypothetical protein